MKKPDFELEAMEDRHLLRLVAEYNSSTPRTTSDGYECGIKVFDDGCLDPPTHELGLDVQEFARLGRLNTEAEADDLVARKKGDLHVPMRKRAVSAPATILRRRNGQLTRIS